MVPMPVRVKPPDDIGDVPLALAEIRIVDLVEERRHLVERALQRGLGVEPFLPHNRGRGKGRDQRNEQSPGDMTVEVRGHPGQYAD